MSEDNIFEFDEKNDNEIRKSKKFEVNFTKFKSKTPLNKTINEDGKKYANAYFSDGEYTTIKIKDLIGLKKVLLKINKFEAIGLGVHKENQKGEILTKSKSKELARSKENFKWNNNYNLVMLDYDYFEGLTKINSELEYKEVLEKIEPLFKNTQLLITRSTSSMIINKTTKMPLFNTGGFHCYLFIKGSVERFRELLWRSAWKKGHGAIKFAGDGSVLSRTIFDTAVLSPERLVFEAAPNINGNLELLKKDIKIFNNSKKDSLYLDVDAMEANIGKGLKLEAEAKENAKGTSLKIKTLYIQKNAKLLSDSSGCTIEIAEKIVGAKTNNSGVVYENDLIVFPDGNSITARDLNSTHDGKYILDPIEPDQANAIVNINSNGTRSIHSFLHGGKNFEIIPPDLDTELKVSKEAKEITVNFLKEIWNDMFSYGFSEKLYQNWETMFQAYIDASKPNFDTMYVISTSAGSAKTTTLAYYIKTRMKETQGKFSTVVVVNTIQNGIDFKNFLNEILSACDPDVVLPRAKIMFAKDKEVLEDMEGNLTEYYSDVNSTECPNAEILIITHARLRKAVITGKTDHLLEYNSKESLIPTKRDFFAVDEAIDFEEKAIIKQSDTYTASAILNRFKVFHNNKEVKEKAIKLDNVLKRFINFCEHESTKEDNNKILSSKDIFGNGEDVEICFDTKFLEMLYENKLSSEISLESYFTDLSILVKSNFFQLNTGADGLIISSNVDRIPTSKGFIVLDASAIVNHEYLHYQNKGKAQRIRVHLDAKRYDAVTIYRSDEDKGVGKIDVPSGMLKDDTGNVSNKDQVKEIESFRDLIKEEILDKTSKQDETLIIANKSFIEYLKVHLHIDRDIRLQNWGNLKGSNQYRSINKVFCLNLPYRPSHFYHAKAYKHGRIEDTKEVSKFRVSSLLDEVYQALLRANIRTNDPITKDSPKCDIYIRTSLSDRGISDSNKIIDTLEKMLIGARISSWKFTNNDNAESYKKIPALAYNMRDVIIEWGDNNPHELTVDYEILHKSRSDVFTLKPQMLTNYKNTFLADGFSVLNWLEKQTGFKFIPSREAKKYLFENLNINRKGRGKSCFVRNSKINPS